MVFFTEERVEYFQQRLPSVASIAVTEDLLEGKAMGDPAEIELYRRLLE